MLNAWVRALLSPPPTALAAAAACRLHEAAVRQGATMDLDASSLHYLLSTYLDGPDIAACAQVRRAGRQACCRCAYCRACNHSNACRCIRVNRCNFAAVSQPLNSDRLPYLTRTLLGFRSAAPGGPWLHQRRCGRARLGSWSRTRTCAETTYCQVRCCCAAMLRCAPYAFVLRTMPCVMQFPIVWMPASS